MDDSSSDTLAPTAQGTFAKTPLPHVLVHALTQRLSGTFELSVPTGPAGTFLVIEGQPAKARTMVDHYLVHVLAKIGVLSENQVRNLLPRLLASEELHGRALVRWNLANEEQIELGLRAQLVQQMKTIVDLPAETTWRYYDDVDLLSGWGLDSEIRIDPYPFVWGSLFQRPPWEQVRAALSRAAESALRLKPDAEPARFAFDKAQRALVDRMRNRACRLDTLVATSGLPSETVELVAYCLMLAKQIDFVAASEAALPSEPPVIETPPVSAEPVPLSIRSAGVAKESWLATQAKAVNEESPPSSRPTFVPHETFVGPNSSERSGVDSTPSTWDPAREGAPPRDAEGPTAVASQPRSAPVKITASSEDASIPISYPGPGSDERSPPLSRRITPPGMNAVKPPTRAATQKPPEMGGRTPDPPTIVPFTPVPPAPPPPAPPPVKVARVKDPPTLVPAGTPMPFAAPSSGRSPRSNDGTLVSRGQSRPAEPGPSGPAKPGISPGASSRAKDPPTLVPITPMPVPPEAIPPSDRSQFNRKTAAPPPDLEEPGYDVPVDVYAKPEVFTRSTVQRMTAVTAEEVAAYIESQERVTPANPAKAGTPPGAPKIFPTIPRPPTPAMFKPIPRAPAPPPFVPVPHVPKARSILRVPSTPTTPLFTGVRPAPSAPQVTVVHDVTPPAAPESAAVPPAPDTRRAIVPPEAPLHTPRVGAIHAVEPPSEPLMHTPKVGTIHAVEPPATPPAARAPLGAVKFPLGKGLGATILERKSPMSAFSVAASRPTMQLKVDPALVDSTSVPASARLTVEVTPIPNGVVPPKPPSQTALELELDSPWDEGWDDAPAPTPASARETVEVTPEQLDPLLKK